MYMLFKMEDCYLCGELCDFSFGLGIGTFIVPLESAHQSNVKGKCGSENDILFGSLMILGERLKTEISSFFFIVS